MPFPPRRRRRAAAPPRGFTLTEFAVIFVIVVVAALMVMPLYARYRQKTRDALITTCLSNEKQMAIAILMYTQDYDEHYPLAGGIEKVKGTMQQVGWGVTKSPSGGVQGGLILPYVKNPRVFHCPDGPKTAVLSYRYNDLVAGAKTADFARLSETVLLMDGEELSFNVGHAQSVGLTAIPGATINAKGRVDAGKGALISDAAERHSNGSVRGANYAFADGHCKWHAPDRIFFPPQASASRASVDAKTRKAIGPTPGGAMTFGGKSYAGTFHVR